ncbi:alpha/beta fold hydrolase [Streptomyces gardneri]|uniref:alpha/beta hydrolase n=1 Tax=Streptomyces gardneri TaxID=66892 RepID=UPI0006BC4004|nr:alpha/beta hydrolase [Streptomyces gardneri]QPK47103.1 alpha/beta fold hydrolase [Streptomyces gardneri]WRK38521.1 alpha/beta hydrolase [Streptomyces venezuelae]CUM39483.1 secreted hydrolase [Streptomyces venezuelae]
MTTNRARKALLLALSAAAVAGAALAGGGAAPAAAAGLTWGDCAPAVKPLPGQKCATLSVPLDYADPHGEQIGLAVSRLPSTRPEARRGTLMVIPGGPGSSGVQRLAQKGAALAKEMDGAYDLVAFDPRGIGGSAKARCGLDEGDRWMMTLRSWPGADGGIDENVARSKRVAEACARNGGAMLRGLTTANQVRDMDRLRQALGERKLSAWSVSYGTYVAASYAEKFPGRTDRWVLDSSNDPDPKRVARGWLEGMAQGAEDRFPDFAAWAAHPDRADQGLRLAERPEDVQAVILGLAGRLDREPHASVLPGAPGEPVKAGPPLTGAMLLQALQLALYSDGFFPSFAQLVTEALDPQGEPVLPRELAGAMPDEAAAITVGVICNDVNWPASVPAYERAVANDRKRFPLTAGMPANITPCSFWKGGAVEKPVRITDRGPSNILMIQNLRDPSTPYSKGLKMRAALGERARLVSVDHGGHGAYLGNGNACGDAAVTRYLKDGVRPSEDVLCR